MLKHGEYDDVIDENGFLVDTRDDDYEFYESERDRRVAPLDDDYVREGYRD